MSTNWNRKIVISAGDMMRSPNVKKMRNSPAPSTRAASITSSGTAAEPVLGQRVARHAGEKRREQRSDARVQRAVEEPASIDPVVEREYALEVLQRLWIAEPDPERPEEIAAGLGRRDREPVDRDEEVDRRDGQPPGHEDARLQRDAAARAATPAPAGRRRAGRRGRRGIGVRDLEPGHRCWSLPAARSSVNDTTNATSASSTAAAAAA